MLTGFSFSSPNAAHSHPPQASGQAPPQGPPGALPQDAPGPTEALPVSRLNDMYMQKNQAVTDRLEADSRGYDNVFSQ